MKRMLGLSLALVALGLSTLSRPGYAQDPANDSLRNDVTAFLSKFVDAANRGDTKTLMTMVSTKPQATWIGDGEVYQGPADIQAHIERVLGPRGPYLIQLGIMSIANVNGMALATGSYGLKRRDGDQAMAFQGAVTVLIAKEGRRRWVITHLHRSTLAARPPIG